MADTTQMSSTPGASREDAIEAFLEQYAASDHPELLADMMVTVCRLARDGTGRGELKLLASAFKELRYAFKVFAPFSHVPKVSIFGSSRTPVGHPDYVQADKFARLMREYGWMVITGAGDGIMRAGHDGAGRESSFGVAIRLPFEQATNTIIADDSKLVNFKYFFTRKLLFIKEASAVALFPGGFGTQDEGFEALTLIQTGKSGLVPVVLIDAPEGTYWQHWRTYVKAELLQTGMISEEDMHLFTVTDSADTAAKILTDFYRRYHSMRYVRDVLALRVKSILSDEAITELNDKYHPILTEGKIEQSSGPIDGEAGDWPDLPRITLHFNRRNFGTLRLMVNDINRF